MPAKNGVKLPAGFTQIAVGGAFGAVHDFHKEKILQGKVVSVDTVQVPDINNPNKKVARRVMRVQNGKLVSNVWESYSLKELFDTPKLRGRQVFIQFLGVKKLPGRKKLNEFAAAVK